MRFSVFLCGFLVLASCSSPGGQFRGVDPVRVTVERSEFDVYVLGDQVRVIRMNFEMLPPMAVIGPRAVVAMEWATGCNVISSSFFGDQAMVQARVAC